MTLVLIRQKARALHTKTRREFVQDRSGPSIHRGFVRYRDWLKSRHGTAGGICHCPGVGSGRRLDIATGDVGSVDAGRCRFRDWNRVLPAGATTPTIAFRSLDCVLVWTRNPRPESVDSTARPNDVAAKSADAAECDSVLFIAGDLVCHGLGHSEMGKARHSTRD